MPAKLDPVTQAAMEGKRALLLVSQHVHVRDALVEATMTGATSNMVKAEACWPNGGSLLVRTFEQAWRGELMGLEFDVIWPSGVMDDRLRPTREQRRAANTKPLRYVDGRSVFARRRRKGSKQ